jgi:defect in organelle trafficking protein DotC
MNRTLLAGLALCFTFPGWAAGAPPQDEPPPDISRYLSPSRPDTDVNDTVRQMLNDAGRTVGFRGGKAQRAFELRQALTAQGTTLDALYDFRYLISRQGYLPPVIAAAQDLAHITPDQIRTAYRTYDILVPARFVSNPPTWRTWLLAGLSTARTDEPDASVQPKNSDQRALWKAAVLQGWQDGRDSADQTLEANFHRLTRDYTGMMRYSTLLHQGMVQAPDVAEQQQSVSGSRNKLMIGDKVRRIKDPAGFVVDKKRWTPVIRVVPEGRP